MILQGSCKNYFKHHGTWYTLIFVLSNVLSLFPSSLENKGNVLCTMKFCKTFLRDKKKPN